MTSMLEQLRESEAMRIKQADTIRELIQAIEHDPNAAYAKRVLGYMYGGIEDARAEAAR